MISLGRVDSPQKSKKTATSGKENPLKQLKKVYTQLIKEAQLEGDIAKEYKLAQKYVDALKIQYAEAAKKNDRKTKRAIGSALWYGIPHSFKSGLVIQHKDSVEAYWDLIPKKKTSLPPDQCAPRIQSYLVEVSNLRGLVKEMLDYYDKYREDASPYYVRLYAIYPPGPRTRPIEEAWEAANTEENWELVKETEQKIDSLPEWQQEKFLEKQEAAENGGIEEKTILIEVALQIKLDFIHAEEKTANGIKPLVKQSMQRLLKYKEQSTGPCAIPFDQELHGYVDGSFFTISEDEAGWTLILRN